MEEKLEKMEMILKNFQTKSKIPPEELINNSHFNDANFNLEKEQHEQEILKNILDRTTRDYLSMREKLACKPDFIYYFSLKSAKTLNL